MAVRKLACDRRMDTLRNLLVSQKLHVAFLVAALLYLGHLLAANF